MCGILGLVSATGLSMPSPESFAAGLTLLARRGPDDEGTWSDAHAVLGHRRLSILDLSSAGHQPMFSSDGRYAIVFNGEIYNFLELRSELERDGVAFRSRTDTEVILELFARRGPECVQQLRGMFALAIWDTLEKELFLVRDRLGIKPLYVWESAGVLAFGSEVKALKKIVPGGRLEVNPQAVFAFLTWGSVPTPLTMFKGVRAVRPATWMRIKQGRVEEREYWSIPAEAPMFTTRGQALEALRPALRDAVKLRCIADVPLGAFLSGGIDSSSVVSLMREVEHRDIRTFSVAFPGEELDESGYAATVAKVFETDHRVVPATASFAGQAFDDFFDVMDQPTCDGFNVYLVSQVAKQGGVTVALSGTGGDELFGGYHTFERAQFTEKWISRVPQAAWVGCTSAAARAVPRLAKLESYALPGTLLAQSYFVSRGLFSPREAREILADPWLDSVDVVHLLPDQGAARGSFHATMRFELRRYMHDQLLRDTDVFGMAHALEIRVPLIDHKVVEILARTSSSVIREGEQKALLRDALRAPLPAEVVQRPKMGFTFPFAKWIRTQWREQIESVMLGPSSALRLERRKTVWNDFLNGRVHWSRAWSLYVLLRWLERHGSAD